MKTLHPQLQKCHNKFNLSNSSPLFDYSETIYTKLMNPTIIKCLVCDSYFEQRIDFHLMRRKPKCKCRTINVGGRPCLSPLEIENKKIIKTQRKAEKKLEKLEDFKLTAKNINQNITEYDYRAVELILINGKTHAIKIKCNKCGSLLNQRVEKHLAGQGCKQCRSHMHGIETYRGRPTTLYYVKINNLYKIGLTMSSVKRRFNQEKNNPLIDDIEEIKTWFFEQGEVAYKLEQDIINLHQSIKYDYKTNGEILIGGGNSEMFIENILNEINPLINMAL